MEFRRLHSSWYGPQPLDLADLGAAPRGQAGLEGRHSGHRDSACGGMYTANTMAAAIEALGVSLPYSASNPAVSAVKMKECYEAGERMYGLLQQDLKPRDIMTKAAFENAMRLVTVLGGSTNAVLHLLALARTLELDIDIDDFQRISDSTPLLADLKPSGRYLMEDLHEVGGVPAVMKYMLDQGLLDGSCQTITGKTVAENLAHVAPLKTGQDVIRTVHQPMKANGHIRILYGNLAAEGSVAKITGKEGERFEGTAKVFESEFEANDGIRDGKVNKGDVVVIRYEGPKGGPGMAEMLKPTAAIMGAGLGNDVALITDGFTALAPGGELIFTNNKRNFKMDMEAMETLGVKVNAISDMTRDKDFERNKHIHNSWSLSVKNDA